LPRRAVLRAVVVSSRSGNDAAPAPGNATGAAPPESSPGRVPSPCPRTGSGSVKVALVLTQDRGGPVDLAVGIALELAGRAHGPEIAVMAPEPVTSAGDIRHLLREIHVKHVSDYRGG